jgi:hypothetical protein
MQKWTLSVLGGSQHDIPIDIARGAKVTAMINSADASEFERATGIVYIVLQGGRRQATNQGHADRFRLGGGRLDHLGRALPCTI